MRTKDEKLNLPDADQNITEIDVSTEMKGSFLEYAVSVIHARALPDARDGLKPVQRRILSRWTKWGSVPTAVTLSLSELSAR